VEIKYHYFMTCAALFFLGLVITKPSTTFSPANEERVCKFEKSKIDCEKRSKEYRVNISPIHYEY
jgi:hypothetical protein